MYIRTPIDFINQAKGVAVIEQFTQCIIILITELPV